MARTDASDLIRIGTVFERDLDAATVRVRVGSVETQAIPWNCMRAGSLRIWSPPSIGEQVVIVCPDGDWSAAFLLSALFSAQRPAPDARDQTLLQFDDGAVFAYDHEAHRCTVDLSTAGGAVALVAPGGVSISADVTIVGTVTVTEDVIASDISLVHHMHGGVAAGAAKSGLPE
ncbi:phage baseplate assembly protein V [Novosphingopyxis sp. YJ-S2-01]|uniref:phage baseplate assembly protein V n=1 Tax=Novosphingopyxis sp. YJ-S2-01 TaxID=2794021 RepID=UPI0018DB132E|nr:phage baseplate assembly protein V [Novosphingopyxis sp. YJ-S2-01]MBH9537905.1 phage baseplate assembly protein V [Novosphingopyxis sp. YJ-S2-01]